MNHAKNSRRRICCTVVLLALFFCISVLAGEQPQKPFAVALPDDSATRGDWIGTYGTHFYILGGARSRRALRGGEPVDFSVRTGDAEEKARGWFSSMPTAGNRSVLLEPSGWKRTAACFDDHGEVRPLGEGPDLHIGLSLPSGPCLVSLYFFEIDWIQYRDYQIRVIDAGTQRELLEMPARHFFKGKYKRFMAYGPVDLEIVVERGNSPNAQVSGIFVDRLSLTAPPVLNTARDYLPAFPPNPDESGAHSTSMKERRREAREALAALRRRPSEQGRGRRYVRTEYDLFMEMVRLHKEDPRAYYRRFSSLWSEAEERLATARAILEPGDLQFGISLLRYVAARERCDYATARDQMEEVAQVLCEEKGGLDMSGPMQREMLESFLVQLIQRGCRNEALPVAEHYCQAVLEHEPATRARMSLVRLAEKGVRAKVSMPFARALKSWEGRYGELSVDERLLLAGLYYVAGEHRLAAPQYEKAEPDVALDRRHRWVLIALLTSFLRSGRLEDARQVASRLRKKYPHSAELDEAKYRFSVHYFKKRQLARARRCFEELRQTTGSLIYKKLCRQYLARIEHHQDLAQQR